MQTYRGHYILYTYTTRALYHNSNIILYYTLQYIYGLYIAHVTRARTVKEDVQVGLVVPVIL